MGEVRESEEMIWDMVRERRRRSGERSIMSKSIL
jgi:hypothetical protein